MSEVVLDASAVLAYVQREPGAEAAAVHLTGGLISAVNYAEVLKKAIQNNGSAALTASLLGLAHIHVVPFDQEQASKTAELWPMVKTLGLSLGDRACLALGLLRNATVLTADRRMAEAKISVRVKLIRRAA